MSASLFTAGRILNESPIAKAAYGLLDGRALLFVLPAGVFDRPCLSHGLVTARYANLSPRRMGA